MQWITINTHIWFQGKVKEGSRKNKEIILKYLND